MQSVALLAIVIIGSRASCGEPGAVADAAPEPDAGVDALIALSPDAWIADAALSACVDMAGCRIACEGSGWRDADACVRWADLLRAPHGGRPRRDRIGAREVYRRTCFVTQDALACTRVALAAGLLHDLDLAPEWMDPERAPLGMLAAACSSRGNRGELACAALELLVPASAYARERRTERCPGDGAIRAACAAAVALEVCRADDAEACYLAANGRLPTHAEARDRLRKLCSEQDRPACLYLFALSPQNDPDRSSLIAACSLGDREDESIATACLARTLIKEPDKPDPRTPKFAEFACELGSCQHPKIKPPPGLVTLKRSCEAGHVNGCANLIYANRGSPGAWRPIALDINLRLPVYARRVTADREADEVACALGSLEACITASKRLLSKDPAAAARLNDFSLRLVDPLVAR